MTTIAQDSPNQANLRERLRVRSKRSLLHRIGALDPGGLRLRASARGTFACITAGLLTYATVRLFGVQEPAMVFISILICFVSQLAVLAPQPRERRRALLWGIVAAGIAVTLVALVHQWYWTMYLLMAPLVFLSYYLRRYGLLIASMGLMLLFVYYFATLFGVMPPNLLWAWVASLFAMISSMLWQDYLLPFRPRVAVWQAIGALGGYTGDGVQAAAATLGVDLPAGDVGGAPTIDEDDALRDLHRAGQVIIQQLAALTGPDGWDVTRVGAVRSALYAIGNGLERMVWAAKEIQAHGEALPPEIVEPLRGTLAALAAAARNIGEDAPMQRLSSEVDSLLAASRSAEAADEPQRVSLAHVALGGRQIAESLRTLITLTRASDVESGTENATQDSARSTARAASGAPAAAHVTPTVTIWGRFQVHPTVPLGLQATIAYLIGLLIAYLLGWAHPNWIFWTSYVVVAGSTGESLLKLRNRVLGTVLGALTGSLLILLLPASIWITLAIVIGCFFLALYTRVLSYSWMVFWITIMVAGLYGTSGDPSIEVLVLRPLGVLVGSAIAAATVLWVLPVHTANHFRAALAGYLKSVEAYLDALGSAAFATGPKSAPGDASDLVTPSAVDTVAAQRDAAFDALNMTFPGIAYDFNPLTEARSPLLAQETMIMGLNQTIERLGDDLSLETQEQAGETISVETRAQLHDVLQTVQRNLQRTQKSIDGAAPGEFETVEIGRGARSVRGTVEGETRAGSLPLAARILEELATINQRLRDLAMAQARK